MYHWSAGLIQNPSRILFLTQSEIEITETPATGILEKTTTGQWTALSVAEAFSHRAAVAHQLTSCLTEVLFPSALADARALDAHFAAHKKPVGPLHGLPVSLKDQFCLKGLETIMGAPSRHLRVAARKSGAHQRACARAMITAPCTHNTAGYAGWIGRVAEVDSVLVEILYECGAVPFVRTNVPQTLQASLSITAATSRRAAD